MAYRKMFYNYKKLQIINKLNQHKLIKKATNLRSEIISYLVVVNFNNHKAIYLKNITT